MSKKEDLTGRKFGKLTVLYEDAPVYTPGGYKLNKWVCQCDCGNITSVAGHSLMGGATSSCGCIKHPDLTGQRFGKLTVISKAEIKDDLRHWKCKCDCGNYIDVPATRLKRGITKSCGCLKVDRGREKTKNLIGMRFGKLKVIELETSENGNIKWKCLCDCGNVKIVPSKYLLAGNVRSCGCLRNKFVVSCEKREKLSHTRIYNIWTLMKGRCYNIKNRGYKDYGGRGITVCDEWKNDFQKFYDWAMENGYSDELSIDRIDNNGNYEPSNCRWTDVITQANNKRSNTIIEYNGEKKTLAEWSREIGINYNVLKDRLYKLHWNISKAFETPSRKCVRRK